MKKRIFIAGIIQGSIQEKKIHPQDYRDRLKSILNKFLPDYEVYCPVSYHPNCLEYSDEEAKKTFLEHIEIVKNSALLIAYVPEASMGTAIEMWEAYKNNVEVWSITRMTHNWVVRITSKKIFDDINDLEAFLNSGGKPDG